MDGFQFVLAERLGMTVDELNHRMHNAEFIAWRAFYTWRHDIEEREMAKAKHG